MPLEGEGAEGGCGWRRTISEGDLQRVEHGLHRADEGA